MMNKNNKKKFKRKQNKFDPQFRGQRGPFPTYEIVNCRYLQRIVVQDGANPFKVVDFRISDVRQPVQGGPVGVSTGWTGSISRYLSWRVESVKMSIRVVSNDTGSPFTFSVFCNDTQVTTLVNNYQKCLQVCTNTMSMFRSSVGEIGGMSVYVSPTRSFPVYTVVGDKKLYESDRDYCGTSTSSPNQEVWGSFILISPDPTINLPNGVILDWDIEMRTRFFSLNPLV